MDSVNINLNISERANTLIIMYKMTNGFKNKNEALDHLITSYKELKPQLFTKIESK